MGGPDALKPLPMPLQTMLTMETRLRIDRANATEHMGYPVGQIVGDMNTETNVRQIIHDFLNEFIDATERVNTLLNEEQ